KTGFVGTWLVKTHSRRGKAGFRFPVLPIFLACLLTEGLSPEVLPSGGRPFWRLLLGCCWSGAAVWHEFVVGRDYWPEGTSPGGISPTGSGASGSSSTTLPTGASPSWLPSPAGEPSSGEPPLESSPSVAPSVEVPSAGAPPAGVSSAGVCSPGE